MIKMLFKPTKSSIYILSYLLAMNAVMYVIVILCLRYGKSIYILTYIASFQVDWLFAIFTNLGIKTFKLSGEFIADPNILGRILIILGSFISLVTYYILASIISYFVFRRSDKHSDYISTSK